MCVAAVATILFRQFKQPVVLGYILAGVIIGPHTPGQFIVDESTIETLAELGVIFPMFSLGLEFSLRKLTKVGATAFIAAALEIVIMILVGYALGRSFGWNMMDSVFLAGHPFHLLHHHHHQGAGRPGQNQGAFCQPHLRHSHRRGHPGHRDDRAPLGLREDGRDRGRARPP